MEGGNDVPEVGVGSKGDDDEDAAGEGAETGAEAEAGMLPCKRRDAAGSEDDNGAAAGNIVDDDVEVSD